MKAENAQLSIQVAERDSLVATLRSEVAATGEFARKSEGQQEEFRIHLTRVTNAFIPAVAALAQGPPRPPGNFVTPEEVSMIVAELGKSRQDLALAANREEELRSEAAARARELEEAREEAALRKRAEERGERARAELAPAVQEAERLGAEVRRLEAQNGLLQDALRSAELDRQLRNLERAEGGGRQREGPRAPAGGGGYGARCHARLHLGGRGARGAHPVERGGREAAGGDGRPARGGHAGGGARLTPDGGATDEPAA